jgi:citrate synthase
MTTPTKAGLEDVVVSTSEICFIDGDRGRLLYRGFDIDDLVEHSSFEEVAYLLWHGPLPTRKDLEAHVLEQHANNRLIRPRSEYTAPASALYVPLDDRSPALFTNGDGATGRVAQGAVPAGPRAVGPPRPVRRAPRGVRASG